jgi:hypothetical protein
MTARDQKPALRHGAYSDAVVRREAGYVKQAVLRPWDLRLADLDPTTVELLDLYARTKAKLDLYDSDAGERGYLRDGVSPPWVKEYFAAVNTAARILERLDVRLRALTEKRKPTSIHDRWAEVIAEERGEQP